MTVEHHFMMFYNFLKILALLGGLFGDSEPHTLWMTISMVNREIEYY